MTVQPGPGQRPPGVFDVPPPGTEIGERYLLLGHLGRGASGVVYRARDNVLESDVALKFLRPEASDRDRKRFRREVALAQKLTHPGLARVHDIGMWNGIPYLSMELIVGASLSAQVRETGPVSFDSARQILAALADVLAYLHDNGVVHRDIKPANILMQASDGRPRLTDLGLAKGALDLEASQTEVAGTPGYMAPEQMLGDTPTTVSDLYSLGATLYMAMTGKRTHEGDSWAEVAKAKKTPPPPLTTVRPDTPEDLAIIVERCLEPDPEQRFQSARDILAALGQPTARPTLSRGAPTTKGSLPRRGRRWQATVALAGAAVLLAVGAGWAWSASGQAVEVVVEGTTVRGVNLWGGIAWEVLAEGPSVGAGAWGADAFRIDEHDVREDYNWPLRARLFDRRGGVLFDSAANPGFVPSVLRSPTDESSGILALQPTHWSPGFGTAGRNLTPVVGINYPWYLTLLGFQSPGNSVTATYLHPGRLYSIAAAPPRPDGAFTVGVFGMNNEWMQMSGFAILPGPGGQALAPPRMVDQSHLANALLSYTLLPSAGFSYGGDAVRARPDGGWDLCARDGRCEALDAFGNRASTLAAAAGKSPEAVRDERMALFEALSGVDASRRSGNLDAADAEYLRLAATPPVDPLERAVLYWVGGLVAVARGDVPATVERTKACETLWTETEHPLLLRARARILAGEMELAEADLHEAQARRASAVDNVRFLRFAAAVIAGDRDLARRLADAMTFPYIRAVWQAYLELSSGNPAEALRVLDPWRDHYVRDRVNLLRGLALIDLGRTEEARVALRSEVDRHGWLRADVSWALLAADLRDGTRVEPERALELLRGAETSSHAEVEARLLLPRVRIEVATALVRAGRGDEAEPVLRALTDGTAGAAAAGRAEELLLAFPETAPGAK